MATAIVMVIGCGLLATGCAAPPGGSGESGQSSSASSAAATALDAPSTAVTTSAVTSSATAAEGTALCVYEANGNPARPVDPPPSKDVPATGTVVYTLALSAGDVAVTMDRAKTPCTVNSFAALAKQGFYDDTACHRLIDQTIFILQCGDPTGTGTGGPGYVYADELTGSETYPAGTVAMANAEQANTNGSQFFIVWADSPLPPTYTVFGTIDEPSLAVVQTIASRGVSRDESPKPIAPAVIERVSVG
ncbi:hypothetical protein GCM10009785_06350 [Brooklawnia cerclae]